MSLLLPKISFKSLQEIININTLIGFKCPTGDTPPIVKSCYLTLLDQRLPYLHLFRYKIFLILFREHLLSPATKHNKKEFFVLKNKLFTIEPTSVFKLFAASTAVLAVLSKTITFKLIVKFF